MRILFVEDDPLIREFTAEALRDEGYDVIQESNGEEALEWCKQQVADLLGTGGNSRNAVASMTQGCR
jgi:DNA-binding response OmpR family regulator